MDVPQPAPKEMPLLWKHADLPALEAFLKEEQLRGRFNPDPSLPFRGSSLIHLVKDHVSKLVHKKPIEKLLVLQVQLVHLNIAFFQLDSKRFVREEIYQALLCWSCLGGLGCPYRGHKSVWAHGRCRYAYLFKSQ